MAACLLIAAALSSGAAGAQPRLFAAESRARPEAEMLFLVNGEPAGEEPVQLGEGVALELLVRFSWSGDANAIARAEAGSLALEGARLAKEAGEGPWPADALDARPLNEGGALDEVGPNRWALEWRLPVEAAAAPGEVRAKRCEVSYAYLGVDEEPAPIRARAARVELVRPPSRWLAKTLGFLAFLAGAAGLGFGGWKLFAWMERLRQSRPALPNFTSSSDDPTPFERVHAELASCEMKAQVEDFEGFFRKFHPLLYRFVMATEGPGARTLNADELANHFEQVEYDPKVGAALVAMLKTCERHQLTGASPSAAECLAMTGKLRLLATACARRPPRG